MSNLKLIATSTLSRIANAIREKDPALNYPSMTPIQMSNYIRFMNLHGCSFPGGEGGYAISKGSYLNGTFQNNTVRMYPVITETVLEMRSAFNNCRNLIGAPECNKNVYDGYQMYRDCWNLNGEPSPPNKVWSLINMCQSYYNCVNISGNASVGPLVTDGSYAYWNCSNLNGHIVYNKEYGLNLVNMSHMFHNCVNLHGEPIISSNTTNMMNAYYNCQNLTGNAVVDNTTIEMNDMYENCYNLNGRAACGANVVNMYRAYSNCYNLIGPAAFGKKVNIASRAYANCYNITDAVMSNSMTRADFCFDSCRNLGRSYFSPNIQIAIGVYNNCRNLTGSIIFGKEVTYLQNCFRDCAKLQGVYIIGNSNANASSYNLTRVDNAFNRAGALADDLPLSRLNVVFSQRVTMNRLATAQITGCTMTWGPALVNEEKIISLPLTYSNGMIYGYRNYTCLYQWYNEEHNLYFYSIN